MSPRPHGALWRAFRSASWLGWQIESNWTDPFLFAVYSVVKPVAGASIVVMIYSVVTHASFGSPVFHWMFVGSALYLYFGALLTGMSQAVIDDRERYRMLKYVFVTPAPFALYLTARGMTRIATGSFSVWITLLFGVLFLHVPLRASHTNFALLLAGSCAGIVLLTSLAITLASMVLLIAHHSDAVGDAVAGAMYLFSGAAFPLSVLPAVLRPVGFVLPVAWWLELMRRALLGTAPEGFRAFSGFGDWQLAGIVTAQAAAAALCAALALRLGTHLAQERGLLDRVTNY